MTLEASRGDKVMLVAKGPDAREALERITPMIAEGLGDEGCVPVSAPATMTLAPIAAPAPRKDVDPNLITGVAASSGIAVGEIYQVRHTEIQVREEGESPDHERRLLDEALATAAGQLETLRAQLHGRTEQAKAAIFAAHAELLEDPDLIEIAASAIAGKSAAFAVKAPAQAGIQPKLRDPLAAEKAKTLINALGGKANIQRVDACAETRLRIVTTNGAMNEAALKTAGVEGIVRLPAHVVHLLTGLNVDQYAAEMRGQLAAKSSSQ